jgi:hypothetical protein
MTKQSVVSQAILSIGIIAECLRRNLIDIEAVCATVYPSTLCFFIFGFAAKDNLSSDLDLYDRVSSVGVYRFQEEYTFTKVHNAIRRADCAWCCDT